MFVCVRARALAERAKVISVCCRLAVLLSCDEGLEVGEYGRMKDRGSSQDSRVDCSDPRKRPFVVGVRVMI